MPPRACRSLSAFRRRAGRRARRPQGNQGPSGARRCLGLDRGAHEDVRTCGYGGEHQTAMARGVLPCTWQVATSCRRRHGIPYEVWVGARTGWCVCVAGYAHASMAGAQGGRQRPTQAGRWCVPKMSCPRMWAQRLRMFTGIYPVRPACSVRGRGPVRGRSSRSKSQT